MQLVVYVNRWMGCPGCLCCERFYLGGTLGMASSCIFA
jgi:hypothetical protein